jgi:class 3 adenylate cyclase
MTVMFCDIVGSTPLAETLDPEDFREILSSYQEVCARATDRFHGYTARYAGDGIVVYFGYPNAREDSAECAVHAGLAMLEELEELNAELRAEHGLSLRVRIGIHTGMVVAGEMGVGEMRERMAIVGETPHIAARLESIAAPQAVVISDATRDLVEGYFVTDAQHRHGRALLRIRALPVHGPRPDDRRLPGARGGHRRLRAGDRGRRRAEREAAGAARGHGAGRAPGRTGGEATALERVAELGDWLESMGSRTELPDIVRARRLLSVQHTTPRTA